ncbi:putative disease resistance protein RGA3 [Cannabis sativa]|uniref:putative disease resistance protein RGA3 n=1 Tax=Cannabis sativa TaxID=3483 RepID=UPI0029C9E216|nr:putative disease resistance protein RGA3 [Cannabis sativa]
MTKNPNHPHCWKMGGIGKTTLARNAYNDAEIKTIFEDKMIWVCVSDPFDIGRIANETIKQLTRQTPADKRFLLVLDYVWTTDYKKFSRLVVLKLGSTVVVTMQNEEVAKMIGDTNKICMDKLAEEDCWLLLREIALSNRMEQTFGSLLHVKDIEDWLETLTSELWELKNVEERNETGVVGWKMKDPLKIMPLS